MTATDTPSWAQLTLDGGEEPGGFGKPVMALDMAATTNGERVRDLHRLGYLPGPVLDPTYGSEGGMWTVYRPDDLVAHDLDPARSPTGESVSFLSLPYEDREFGSCLFDPPYKFVGTPSDEDGDHDDRYGNTQRLGHTGQWQLIVDGAVECGRVTDQYLIVKCQRQVVLFNIFHQPYEITKAMAEHGWQLKDELLLPSYRAQPSGRSQRNSRSNYSTFVVLRRA